jgi:hypothetical protein
VIDSSFYGVSANKKYRDKNSDDAFSGQAPALAEFHGVNFTLRNCTIQLSPKNYTLSETARYRNSVTKLQTAYGSPGHIIRELEEIRRVMEQRN